MPIPSIEALIAHEKGRRVAQTKRPTFRFHCPSCNSTSTRLRVSTNTRVCIQCGTVADAKTGLVLPPDTPRPHKWTPSVVDDDPLRNCAGDVPMTPPSKVESNRVRRLRIRRKRGLKPRRALRPRRKSLPQSKRGPKPRPRLPPDQPSTLNGGQPVSPPVASSTTQLVDNLRAELREKLGRV